MRSKSLEGRLYDKLKKRVTWNEIRVSTQEELQVAVERGIRAQASRFTTLRDNINDGELMRNLVRRISAWLKKENKVIWEREQVHLSDLQTATATQQTPLSAPLASTSAGKSPGPSGTYTPSTYVYKKTPLPSLRTGYIPRTDLRPTIAHCRTCLREEQKSHGKRISQCTMEKPTCSQCAEKGAYCQWSAIPMPGETDDEDSDGEANGDGEDDGEGDGNDDVEGDGEDDEKED